MDRRHFLIAAATFPLAACSSESAPPGAPVSVPVSTPTSTPVATPTVKPAGNATFVFSFDTYQEAASIALPIMSAKNLVGTFYADPPQVNQPGQATISNISTLKQRGWEIGVYLQGSPDMVSMRQSGTALERIRSAHDTLRAMGFEAVTAAPNSRRWDAELAEMARGRFKAVRAPQVAIQPYPIPDPLWIKAGGHASWSGADTAEGVCAQIDEVIANNSLGIAVIHKVGPVGAADCVATPVFQAAVDYAASKVAAGLLRVCTLEQALTAP